MGRGHKFEDYLSRRYMSKTHQEVLQKFVIILLMENDDTASVPAPYKITGI